MLTDVVGPPKGPTYRYSTAMDEKRNELMYRWFEEVWNQRRESTIDEVAASDVIAHGFGTEPLVGTEGFKVAWRSLLETFGDFHVDVTHVMSVGEFISVRVELSGRHVGPGL